MTGIRTQPQLGTEAWREGGTETGMDVEASRESARQAENWESEGGAIIEERTASPALPQAPPSPAQHRGPRRHSWDDQPMTGTITDLRPGGFGFIASEARGKPWSLMFRRSAVAADGFANLRVGQRVRFVPEPVPGNAHRQHAIAVVPLD